MVNVIYRIIDTLTGEMYIGSKVNYKVGKYFGSPRLQRAREVIKTRPESLEVEILENVEDRKTIIEREVFWQKMFNVVEDPMYWNQCYANKGFCSLGKKLTPEHKAKIAPHGRKHTEETKNKMKLMAMGRGPTTDVVRQKLSKIHKGKTLTPEHIEIIKERHRGNKYRAGSVATEETKYKMSIKRKGVLKSEETKQRMKLAWGKRKQKMLQ